MAKHLYILWKRETDTKENPLPWFPVSSAYNTEDFGKNLSPEEYMIKKTIIPEPPPGDEWKTQNA